jgi:predicted esterase YcpF (UPF0227 family)
MKILFLHGLESSPTSYKVKMLEDAGLDVYAPSLPPNSWERAVRIARMAVDGFKPDVIVGSSRGGAIAMVSAGTAPLILIAPAWKKYAPWATVSGRTTIIHSPEDDVVKFNDSVDLAHAFGAMLVEAGEDHRMNDQEATDAILDALTTL